MAVRIELKADAGGLAPGAADRRRGRRSGPSATVASLCRASHWPSARRGSKSKMTPRLRRAERPGDEDQIPRPRAGTQHGLIAAAFAQQRDVEKKLRRARGLAADQIDAVFFRDALPGRDKSRASRATDSSFGTPSVITAASGAAPIAARSLSARASALRPISSGVASRREVDALHHGIGLEEEKVILPLAAQHGAVVAHAGQHARRIGFPAAGEQMQQAVLAQRGQAIVAGRSSRRDSPCPAAGSAPVARLKQA